MTCGFLKDCTVKEAINKYKYKIYNNLLYMQ